MENVAKLIPHHLGRAPPLLIEYYKKAPCPFSYSTKSTPKKWFKRSVLPMRKSLIVGAYAHMSPWYPL